MKNLFEQSRSHWVRYSCRTIQLKKALIYWYGLL